MKRNDNILWAAIFCMLASTQLVYAQPQTPQQKFFPLQRGQVQSNRVETPVKFIPLKRPAGKPLVFVPSGRQPGPRPMEHNIQPAPSAIDKPASEPLTTSQANGLLSIYESVE